MYEGGDDWFCNAHTQEHCRIKEFEEAHALKPTGPSEKS